MLTNVADTIMLVAFFQAIVAKLCKLREQNMGFRIYDKASNTSLMAGQCSCIELPSSIMNIWKDI
jgi:hypothetical protein